MQVSEVDDFKKIRAYLKTDIDGDTVIQRIERMSKPGCRVYHPSRRIPKVLRGMGVGIYSTSKGILSDRDCRGQRMGGEYVGRVW